MHPRPFNPHSPGAGGSGLVQYVFRSPARNPPIESSRRCSCAAPVSEKRSSFCYAGGVALNGIANRRIITEGNFARWFVQPAAEDSGTALGAAFYGLWKICPGVKIPQMSHDSFGRHYQTDVIVDSFAATGTVAVQEVDDPACLAAGLLNEGEIIGWFQGGSEFGPRALGHRSILADPRRISSKVKLNRDIKRRECFRPFAPAVLEEEVQNWFYCIEFGDESPFMLFVHPFREEVRVRVPAVCHVDGTGRLQSVSRTNREKWPIRAKE